MLSGSGVPPLGLGNINFSFEEKTNLIYIHKYNPKAAAGGGTLVPAEYIEYFTAFDESWFRAFVNALPKHVTAITAEGDSMKPIINNGDLLLVDNSKTAPQDGIYVLNINDSLVVKRTQLLPNYKMRIISENPAYQPYEVDLKEDNVFIVGKVVWQGREMG